MIWQPQPRTHGRALSQSDMSGSGSARTRKLCTFFDRLRLAGSDKHVCCVCLRWRVELREELHARKRQRECILVSCRSTSHHQPTRPTQSIALAEQAHGIFTNGTTRNPHNHEHADVCIVAVMTNLTRAQPCHGGEAGRRPSLAWRPRTPAMRTVLPSHCRRGLG